MRQRYGTHYSVIIIDIDKFKEVNDIHGHQVGDVILQELATILKKMSRNTDIVGRWGGEEFLIILPNTRVENALVAAESLRLAVEAFEFTSVHHKTISLGVSQYEKNTDEMIKRADDALYQAKERGRNKVES